MKKWFLFFLVIAAEVKADSLSPVALYNRCYAHFTRSRPPSNDPRPAQLRAGQLNYVDACMQVFDSAKLDRSTGELITKNDESIKVLETFNRLHISWFDDVNVFNALIPGGENLNHFVHDGSEGALHFTHALFHPDGQFRNAITSDVTYKAIRSKGYNTFGIWPTTTKRTDKWGNKDVAIYIGTGASKQEKTLAQLLDADDSQNGLHIQMGKLIGIEPMKPINITDKQSYDSNWIRPSVSNPVDITKSFGAGVIGTQPYIMINRVRGVTSTEDGGLRSGRIWSKQVFKEILCRDIPVVQPKDVISLVDQSGTHPFPYRNSSSCMQCHSSIDPMAWSIRNTRLVRVGDNHTTFLNVVYFLENYKGNLIAQENGPLFGLGSDTSDSNFYKRPSKGHFYFRTYDGKLISLQVDGLSGASGLGEVIANLDDYYICAGKRYLEFFTGHKVILEDITDLASKKLNAKEMRLRNFSISLGKKLRHSQSLREVVQAIISSDYYKSSDYDIKF